MTVVERNSRIVLARTRGVCWVNTESVLIAGGRRKYGGFIIAFIVVN